MIYKYKYAYARTGITLACDLLQLASPYQNIIFMPEQTHPGADPSGLLPALHRLQEEHGYIPDHAIAQLAKIHNLSQADIIGVIGFYHDFRRTPPGRSQLLICRAESCQAMGADALAGHASQRLDIAFGETTRDGAYTLEAAYCLGNCACSPAMMVNGKLLGRVSAERLDTLLDEIDQS